MKLAVDTNHLGGTILYRILEPSNKQCHYYYLTYIIDFYMGIGPHETNLIELCYSM